MAAEHCCHFHVKCKQHLSETTIRNLGTTHCKTNSILPKSGKYIIHKMHSSKGKGRETIKKKEGPKLSNTVNDRIQ